MHELGITRRVLEVVLERATEARATRITAVHIEIGDESDVAPESVALYWPDVSRRHAGGRGETAVRKRDDPFAFRMTSIDVEDPDSA